MTRLFVVSDCGGVGRTTVAANLGHALAARGEVVRLRDVDPQQALAVHFQSLERTESGPVQGSMSGPISRPLATNLSLSLEHDIEHRPGDGGHDQARLQFESSRAADRRSSVDSEPSHTDADTLEIIDTPCAWTAGAARTAAVDYVLCVITPEARCFRTLPSLLSRYTTTTNNGLIRNFIGVINAHDPDSALARDTLDLIEDALGGRLLRQVVLRDQSLPEAFAVGLPIAEQAPWSQAANAFGQLADTFIAMKTADHVAA